MPKSRPCLTLPHSFRFAAPGPGPGPENAEYRRSNRARSAARYKDEKAKERRGRIRRRRSRRRRRSSSKMWRREWNDSIWALASRFAGPRLLLRPRLLPFFRAHWSWLETWPGADGYFHWRHLVNFCKCLDTTTVFLKAAEPVRLAEDGCVPWHLTVDTSVQPRLPWAFAGTSSLSGVFSPVGFLSFALLKAYFPSDESATTRAFEQERKRPLAAAAA